MFSGGAVVTMGSLLLVSLVVGATLAALSRGPPGVMGRPADAVDPKIHALNFINATWKDGSLFQNNRP